MAAAAEFEFCCPETLTQNPPDHQQQYLCPVTFLQFAFRALNPEKHQCFHI